MPTRIAAALMTLLMSAGCSAAPQPDLPASVAAELGQLATQCREVGGTPQTDAAVRRMDLNADNLDDYVLFAGWLNCDNAPGVFGDREKSLSVFVADEHSGARKAFEGAVFDVRAEANDKRVTLWLTTTAENCGKAAAAAFADEFFCERSIVWLPSGGFEFAPLSSIRRIE